MDLDADYAKLAASQSPFAQRAAQLLSRGFSIIPCQPREKDTVIGATRRTRDASAVTAWAGNGFFDANVGICADENFTLLESDDVAAFAEKVRGITGKDIPRTLQLGSGRENRACWIFRRTPACGDKNCSSPGLFEFRNANQYVVGPGSIHPNGSTYRWLDDAPVADMPGWLADAVNRIYLDGKPQHDAGIITPGERIPVGQRHSYLVSQGGRLLHAGIDLESLTTHFLYLNSEKFAEPEREDVIRAQARDMYNRWHEEPQTIIVNEYVGESGAVILDDVVSFLRRFLIMSDAQFTAVALWIVHTYLFLATIWTPYCAVSSAEKRSGKSRLLECLSYLVRAPWQTSSATAATLYRKIEEQRPSLLLDEVDALFRGEKEMAEAVRATLNAGAHYRGVISRCVGQGSNQIVKDFSAFCPKALAGIGNLPDTVADRALPIRLRRKLRDQRVERLRERTAEPLAAPLRKRLLAWADEHYAELEEATPELPEELNDRQQDGAEPLLAIADIAGGEWPQKARTALVELYTGEAAEDQSPPTVLLADIKRIFECDEGGKEREKAVDRLGTADILSRLHQVETSPWSEWNGKPLTAHGLARLLKPFGIRPGTKRSGGETFKGYLRADFTEEWKRHFPEPPSNESDAPPPAINPSHPSQANVHAGPEAFSEPSQGDSVTDSKSEESSVFTRVVTDVTVQNGGKGGSAQTDPRDGDGWEDV